MSLPLAPRDLATAWAIDPAVAVGLAALVWLWARGRAVAVPDRGRTTAFGAAVAVLVVALVSPLDAAAEALVSAHMVQHLLLAVVAAPLLVAAGPATLVRGLPPRLRRASARATGRTRRVAGGTPLAAVAAVAAYLGAWTAWHVPALYTAAVRDPLVHALEHVTLLGAGVAFWTVVLRSRRADGWRGLIALFAATVHGGVLAALLVFAPVAFYVDAVVTAPFGLDPHVDQQLAGVLMWVPGGFVLLAAAARLVVRWVRWDDGDREPVPAPPLPPTRSPVSARTGGPHAP